METRDSRGLTLQQAPYRLCRLLPVMRGRAEGWQPGVPAAQVQRGALPPILLAGAGPLEGAVEQVGKVAGQGGRLGAIGEVGGVQHAGAVGGVPGVIAVGPGQHVCHGREEVVEGDADDHVVVDADVRRHHHHAIAHTWGRAGELRPHTSAGGGEVHFKGPKGQAFMEGHRRDRSGPWQGQAGG